MADLFRTISKQNMSEFDHKWACWANNHQGWQKAKKKSKNCKGKIEKHYFKGNGGAR